MSTWTPVIGLEVHCQLKTWTKLFCGCRNEFGAPPNSRTCPVCTGQPGALPVLNREALTLAVRAALALQGELAPLSTFERKHYFYCDLPKGFQISQYARPFCTGGALELASRKRVRIVRIHLEEDAGKAIHDRGDTTLVDLNRAGVPLIESVTAAELSSADEAHEYLTALKEILMYVGASDCDMEKGSLRCDVNVSVRQPGEGLRTKVELKNLNSFRHVRQAIVHETARQIAAYESGREVVQETRLYDAERDVTRPMRSKEDAHDYRYFPEPDLPPVRLRPAQIEREKRGLPELPAARRARYQEQLGLSAYDAGVLTARRALADFFEATARLSGEPKAAANWIANELSRLLADAGKEGPEAGEGIDELRFKPYDLAELIGLVERGRVSQGGAKKILAQMFATGQAPGALMHSMGLVQVDDPAQIEAWCRAALAQAPGIAADVRAGKQQAIGRLIGAVMKQSGGRAHPEVTRETLVRLIHAEGA
jgi:aspartyl-tRNA(Asn)/glutamyl-tRNA(Gln) amidotransferase subunit B